MLKFKFEIKAKNSNKVFSDDLPPGVLVEMVISYADATEDDKSNPLFIKSLLDMENKILNECIEVVISPYEDEPLAKTDIKL